MTLVLSRSEVATLLPLDDCIAAVEAAFRLEGEGGLPPAGILGMPAVGGGFHLKAAFLPLQRSYFAAKVNGNFPSNPQRCGLPAIQGIVLLADAANGEPLAVMDSIEITLLRTGAATAVAARRLAREDARVAAICGCGNQGAVQLRALARVLRLRKGFAWDADPGRARAYADRMSRELDLEVEATAELAAALRESDVCVTCTPARAPFLRLEHLKPGSFVAAVGADSPEKQELDPRILASSTVVVDVLEQCATIGELHHALEDARMTRADVHAGLGEIVAGRKPGRRSDGEIIVFDSTGTALEDAAAAALVYENALRSRAGTVFALGQA